MDLFEIFISLFEKVEMQCKVNLIVILLVSALAICFCSSTPPFDFPSQGRTLKTT